MLRVRLACGLVLMAAVGCAETNTLDEGLAPGAGGSAHGASGNRAGRAGTHAGGASAGRGGEEGRGGSAGGTGESGSAGSGSAGEAGRAGSSGSAGGNTGPGCVGEVPRCATLSYSECAEVPGCVLDGQCTGGPNCGSYDNRDDCMMASGKDGCYLWSPFCWGTATPCSALGERDCALHPACTWE